MIKSLGWILSEITRTEWFTRIADVERKEKHFLYTESIFYPVDTYHMRKSEIGDNGYKLTCRLNMYLTGFLWFL